MAKKLLVVPGVLLASAVPVFVGYLKISNTYDDFQGEVFSSVWTYLFLLALVIVTWALVGLLGFIIGPKLWGPFAIVVGALVGVLILGPLAIVPLRGADAPGNPERYRLVNIPGPLEELLTDKLDDRVRKKQATETDAFVKRYVGRGAGDRADLSRRLQRALRARDDDLSPAQRNRVRAKARTILRTRRVRFTTRLRRIARVLYEAGLRDTVQELAQRRPARR